MAGLADYKSALKAFIESQSPGSRERMIKEFKDYDARILEKQKLDRANELLAQAAFESEQRKQAVEQELSREKALAWAQAQSQASFGNQSQIYGQQQWSNQANALGNFLGNGGGSGQTGSSGNGWSGSVTTTAATGPSYQMWPLEFSPPFSRPFSPPPARVTVKAGPPRIKADPPVGDRVIVFDDDV